MTAVIAGLFALAGVALGVLLEPLRALIASRARNRQERIERCGRLVEAATAAVRLSGSLNDVFRGAQRGARPVSEEQTNEVISRYNDAYDRVGVTAALLRLSGPDELGEAADAVLVALDEVHRRTQAPDDEQSRSTPGVLPAVVQSARDDFRAALDRFTESARRFTR